MKIGFEAKRIFHNKTGLGNYSRDLVRILATYFPENQYYLYNPKENNENLFSIENKSIFEKLPNSLLDKKFKNFWRQKTIVKDLINDNVKLFHGLSGEIPYGLKKNNIKSVVTIHDLIFMRYPKLYSFFDRQIHYYKFKKAAQNADIIIAISEQTKKDIIEYLKISDSKIKVIYQGCQDVFKQSYSNNTKNEVKSKFQLPSNFILNVGTLEARKNALSIVKAIKNLDTHLVLIGKKTDYYKEIKSYIETNNLQHKITILKGVTNQELAIIYQLATVFVYPSIFEGFGIPIIEALFSKTPVITSNNGVFPEAGGPHSIYLENMYDENELAEKINHLLISESNRTEITEKGFQFVQKFNDDVIANQVIQIYKSLF
jgi:glycosyltransferase involved in cell wall biosynthesis